MNQKIDYEKQNEDLKAMFLTDNENIEVLIDLIIECRKQRDNYKDKSKHYKKLYNDYKNYSRKAIKKIQNTYYELHKEYLEF